jgi:hypothetical protein
MITLSLTLFVFGCESKFEYQTNIFTRLEEIPENFSFDDAVANNYVVVTNGSRYNIDTLNIFLSEVENNRPSSLRYVIYFAESSKMRIYDVYFDTNQFIVFFDNTRRIDESGNTIEFRFFQNWHFQGHTDEKGVERRELALTDENAADDKMHVIIG